VKIKPGVSVRGLHAEILLGAQIVAAIYCRHNVECTITSGTEGVHKVGSAHYTGRALDFRTRNLTQEQMESLLQECKEALSSEFDVILEQDHLHLEFDPKRKMS